jgi:hypothetical protein
MHFLMAQSGWHWRHLICGVDLCFLVALLRGLEKLYPLLTEDGLEVR